MATPPRRSLGRHGPTCPTLRPSFTINYTLSPEQGGLDLPSAVVEFGLVPWARELIVELNDDTKWGALARSMLDHEIAAVQAGIRPPTEAATRLHNTHIARIAAALAGHGFFIRDLAHKTHARFMDLLAERLLYRRGPLPGHYGPHEHYGPAEPAEPWDAQRHAAWAAGST